MAQLSPSLLYFNTPLKFIIKYHLHIKHEIKQRSSFEFEELILPFGYHSKSDWMQNYVKMIPTYMDEFTEAFWMELTLPGVSLIGPSGSMSLFCSPYALLVLLYGSWEWTFYPNKRSQTIISWLLRASPIYVHNRTPFPCLTKPPKGLKHKVVK